ncbi:MAG: response regulator, partial [Deltaproteobacteria bacterium]
MDKFSVLLVDDETDFLETMIKSLKKRNLKVTGAGSGEEAIKILK